MPGRNKDPLISVVIPTGRQSYGSLVGLEAEHIFTRTLQSLENQTFKDFELIIPDACAAVRDLENEISKAWSFPIRVAPVKSFWIDQGKPAIQKTCNTGCLYANGKYVLLSGDCCEYPPELLGRIADWCLKGFRPHIINYFKRGGNLLYVTKENEMEPFNHGGDMSYSLKDLQSLGIFDDLVCDSRRKFVQTAPKFDAPWTWFNNHAVFGLDEWKAVNGFDEQLDGSKSLVDCDFGYHLYANGFWRPVLAPELFCWDNDHYGWDARVFTSTLGAPRSNFTLMNFKQQNNIRLSNSYVLTPHQAVKLLEDGAVAREDRVPMYERNSPERHLQALWIKNQQILDYKKLWEDRRKEDGYTV